MKKNKEPVIGFTMYLFTLVFMLIIGLVTDKTDFAAGVFVSGAFYCIIIGLHYALNALESCKPEEDTEVVLKYVIATTSFGGELMYLGWQTPLGYDRDTGFFWTSDKIIRVIKDRSTKQHKFLFDTPEEAVDAAIKLDLPQKCVIVELMI